MEYFYRLELFVKDVTIQEQPPFMKRELFMDRI